MTKPWLLNCIYTLFLDPFQPALHILKFVDEVDLTLSHATEPHIILNQAWLSHIFLGLALNKFGVYELDSGLSQLTFQQSFNAYLHPTLRCLDRLRSCHIHNCTVASTLSCCGSFLCFVLLFHFLLFSCMVLCLPCTVPLLLGYFPFLFIFLMLFEN